MNPQAVVQRLVEMYESELVLPVIRGLGLRGEDERDIAQDVWLKVLRHALRHDGLTHVADLRAWLAWTTRNVVISFQLRQANQRHLGKQSDVDIDTLEGRKESPFDWRAYEDAFEVFANTAPPQVVAVYRLVCHRWHTHAKAAAQLGISERTVGQYLRQARNHLQRIATGVIVERVENR